VALAMGWFSFGKKGSSAEKRSRSIFFTNTLSDKKELFVSIKPGQVAMYSCGPTVYTYAHIGNLRTFVFSDTIARVLAFTGYRVRRVINITDVGHLVSDGDEGEDKIAKGAKREGKGVEEIVELYTGAFMRDLGLLDIDTADILFPRATEYIKEQIAMAETLEQRGFAYRTSDGLYFDTTKFPSYGALAGVHDAVMREGARVEVNSEKRHPRDFALWKRTPAGEKPLQEWDSPWGRGGPGWHLECSAMSRALLGQELDIHTGGEDLAQIHHNNEIAQSEAVSTKKFVRYWMHSAFLTMGGEKASKALGNVVLLSEIIEKGIDPLALRYFFYQAQYRTPLSFSWDALAAAAEALTRLRKTALEVAAESKEREADGEARERFITTIFDDLATPQALGQLWEALKDDNYSPEEKWGMLLDADALLGLGLTEGARAERPAKDSELSEQVKELRAKRDAARTTKDFATADTLRIELENWGYRVEDGPKATVLTKRAK